MSTALSAATRRAASPDPVPAAGAVERLSHKADPKLVYYVVRPPEIHPNTPVMVSVHGIAHDPDLHASGLAPLAEMYGALVIAPFFPAEHFPGYQRLGQADRGIRPDLALDAILADASRRFGVDSDRFSLRGYSGGAQFAHRYALAYPGRVRKLILCSAGWYTFPDPEVRFPYGLRRPATGLDINPNLAAFLRIPTLVMVGDRDTIRDGSLNTSPRIDARQGANRLERARRWVKEMAACRKKAGISPDIRLHLRKDRGHGMRKRTRLHREAVDIIGAWLFDDGAS